MVQILLDVERAHFGVSKFLTIWRLKFVLTRCCWTRCWPTTILCLPWWQPTDGSMPKTFWLARCDTRNWREKQLIVSINRLASIRESCRWQQICPSFIWLPNWDAFCSRENDWCVEKEESMVRNEKKNYGQFSFERILTRSWIGAGFHFDERHCNDCVGSTNCQSSSFGAMCCNRSR